MELFVVKNYVGDERPTIKGNGFDGLEVGKDREEAEAFVAFINAVIVEREHEDTDGVEVGGWSNEDCRRFLDILAGKG